MSQASSRTTSETPAREIEEIARYLEAPVLYRATPAQNRGASFLAIASASAGPVVASPDGLLVVDYSATGQAVGVEITAPRNVPLERLNALLAELGEPPLPEEEYLPLRAA